MDIRAIRPPPTLVAVVLFGAILLSLHLMSSATVESSELTGLYSWLLLLNTLGSVVLFGLVATNLYALIRRLKKQEAGSRLTARMIFLYVFLSLAPVSIVFFYSVQFLHQSIDSWFDVQIDRAMEDALALSQAALEQRMKGLGDETVVIAEALVFTPESMLTIELDGLRNQSAASELTLISQQGRVIASSGQGYAAITPNLPNHSILLQLQNEESYMGLEPTLNEGVRIRIVVPVASVHPRFLQALYPIPERLNSLTQTVESAYAHYQQMHYLRSALKVSFSLTLSLVISLTLLAAVWVAFISIDRLVAPIRDLVRGTQAVADGRYEELLPVTSRDELGFLVESFNDMTQRLARTRKTAVHSQQEVENQRAYLETLLRNLTSGVLSFDSARRLRTANQAAGKILGIEMSTFCDKPLAELAEEQPELEKLVEMVLTRLLPEHKTWQEAITLSGPSGNRDLLCRGTHLQTIAGEDAGSVMVFDDMTDLIRAQRNAAWAEVAQRLAHEIKNPLTPIQLSAERMKLKLSSKLEPADGEILERATQTIIQQVEAMKTMLNAFSEYARPPVSHFEKLDINELVSTITALYPSEQTLRMVVSLGDNLPAINADPVRLRQVFHNLIKNGREAVKEVVGGEILITTRCILVDHSRWIEMAVADNGPGIEPERAELVFEPYVTNKTKGTGLGLAIVKKIIEEHDGTIKLDGDYHNGARFVARLPVI